MNQKTSKYGCRSTLPDQLTLSIKAGGDDGDEEEVAEGWKVTEALDGSPWLKKELRDAELRQIIATIVTQHYH